MIKKFYLFLQINLIVTSCLGQGITNHWEMGYNGLQGYPFGGIDINFSNGFPDTAHVLREMEFYVTNGVVSDSSGNLLFYTNGYYIANALNDTMQNGSGINPGPFTNGWPNGLPIPQGNLIIPVPNEINKYYLFHETCTSYPGGLQPLEIFYSIIDMDMDSGRGSVIVKNNQILNDTLQSGELCANQHANGRDWWILFHTVNSNMFYKLLITPSGITIYTQNIGSFRNYYTGASAFSPDGTKFAHYNVKSDIDIYDFDRCTGLLSNFINIPVNDSAIFGSVAFSPNSSILYVPSELYVYQFDLTSANIPSSMLTVATWDGFFSPLPPLATNFAFSLLGPDDKIYINSTNGVMDMHVINSPDSLGLACDLQQHSLHLPAYNGSTIPNFPNYYLGRDVGSPCDSLTPVNEIQNNVIPIRINPNPAQNSFYLNYELPYGENAVVNICNMLGETLIKKNIYWYFKYLQIDCSTLKNGVYFVKVEAKWHSSSAKLVIAR